MKKSLLALLAVLFASNIFAQNDIKQQIIAFTDSTEVMIRNGRKLVVEKITTGKHEDAMKTMDYLKKNVPDEYLVFYPVEELLIALACNNFDMFLFVAANYHTLLEDKSKWVQMEDLTGPLHIYLAQELPLIKKDFLNSKLTQASKEFIQIYLDFYEGKDKLAVNKSIKHYLKTYPETDYKQFLTDLKAYTTAGQMNISIGYGHEFIGGGISNAFDNHFQIMNMEIDWFVNQLYLSFFLNGSVGKILTTRGLPVLKGSGSQNKGDEAFSLKYGVKIGHSVFTNKTVNVFPFLSFGGYQMNADQSNFEDSDDRVKFQLAESFFTGVGTSCDITLKNLKVANSDQKIGSIFIRPTIGYDFFVSKREFSKGNSFYLTLALGIGIGN